MKRRILPLVLSLIFINAYSQDFVSKAIRGENGTSKQFVTFDDDQQAKFNSSQVTTLLGLNTNSSLTLQKTQQDKIGFIHYRYYQAYRGVPVENSMLVAHTKNGLLKGISGSVITDFDPAINLRAAQRLSGAEAVSIAVRHVNAKEYAWQDAGMEQSLKAQTKNANASYKPSASLVWYSPTETINPRELRLCYKVDVYAKQPLSSAYYFVDAITGNVIGKKDRIFFSDVTGTANTAYSSTQTIHSDKTGAGAFRLRDYSKGGGIITLHGESATRGNDYTSTTKNWTLTGTNIAALDAHYGVSQTYAFYFDNFGRNSYDDAGSPLYSYVNDPTYVDNAFWSSATNTMNFNKRSDGEPGGVTGIDVTGHELTHGVTQESSGLNYSYESGAINESMSDIMGKSVQFWSKPTDINWEMSNDMDWIIRSMSNPNSQGQPDTYKGDYWYTGSGDNGGVHYNSGVGNFMFYLLVTGGSGTNDNGDAYSVTGIGLAKADQIIYRTNNMYLFPSAQYSDWRTACVSAAQDLYGAGSAEVEQVQNAWHAVGIGAAGGPCTVPSGLSASSIFSSSAKVSWSAIATAEKYNLRYKEASASAWTAVNNIAATFYNLSGLTPSTTYKFKVQSVCEGGEKSAFSTPVAKFKTAPPGTYCSISGSTGFEYINKVILKDINNTSGNNSGYGDYTSLSTNLAAGSSVTIKLTPGFIGSAYTEYWVVYIDYNHNGDFTDAGEKVAVGNGSSAINKNFTVPLTATNGTTRLRVIMNYNSALSQTCGSFSYGEAEDYSVKITGGTLNAVAESSIKENTVNSITVSPNPVKGSSANLVLQLSKAGKVNIKISDLSGRILRSDNISSIVAGKNNYSLRNLNLLPGTYMVVAEQSNTIIARTQFIVDK